MARGISYIALLLLVTISCTLVAAAGTADLIFCKNVRAPESWEWDAYPCLILKDIEIGKCYNYPKEYGRKGQSWSVKRSSHTCYVYEDATCKGKLLDLQYPTDGMADVKKDYGSFACICDYVFGCK